METYGPIPKIPVAFTLPNGYECGEGYIEGH